MLERLAEAVGRSASKAVCHAFDLHVPAPAIKTNGLFLYSRCRFCTSIITRTGTTSWRTAEEVNEAYLAEMRDFST